MPTDVDGSPNRCLPFFESELAYLAGYGIKCMLIAQSLSQIEKAYGPQNSILDNAHVRVTYGALDERTAKRISELLGQSTQTRRHRSLEGKVGTPWFDHVTQSEQEFARPLLTPGEVLQLPFDQALLLVGGIPPYRAKKVMYFQDKRFMSRALLPPPESFEEQAAELLPCHAGSAWPLDPLPSSPLRNIEHCEPATTRVEELEKELMPDDPIRVGAHGDLPL